MFKLNELTLLRIAAVSICCHTFLWFSWFRPLLLCKLAQMWALLCKTFPLSLYFPSKVTSERTWWCNRNLYYLTLRLFWGLYLLICDGAHKVWPTRCRPSWKLGLVWCIFSTFLQTLWCDWFSWKRKCRIFILLVCKACVEIHKLYARILCCN